MKVAVTIIAILWVAAATYGEYVGWQRKKARRATH